MLERPKTFREALDDLVEDWIGEEGRVAIMAELDMKFEALALDEEKELGQG